MRADPVPAPAMQVAVERIRLEFAERRRQPGRSVRSGFQFVRRAVEHVRDAIRVAQRVIDFQAVLVRLLDRAPVLGDVVVVHVVERAGSGSAIRDEHRARERDVIFRGLAEPFHGNLVVGERIADEHPVHATLRGRIVNRDALTAGVHPVRKVAVPHLRRRHAAERRVAALACCKTLRRTRRRTCGCARCTSRESERAPQRPADVALLVDALGRLEKSLLVERVVAEETVG